MLSVVQEPAPGKQIVPKRRRGRGEADLHCSDETVDATLERGDGGIWSTDVDLPADGTWFARLERRRQGRHAGRAPRRRARGARPGAARGARGRRPQRRRRGARAARTCSAFSSAVGRMNALGGLDGGRKVALARARRRRLGRAGQPSSPKRRSTTATSLALVGACGAGADGAVQGGVGRRDARRSSATRPLPLVEADNVFRLAGDPYAEGYADGQYIEEHGRDREASRTSSARSRPATPCQRAGCSPGCDAGLDESDLELDDAAAVGRSTPTRRSSPPLLDQSNAAAVVVDGDPPTIAERLRALGSDRLDFATAPVFAADRRCSRRTWSDAAARSGGSARSRAPTEVAPDTHDRRDLRARGPGAVPGRAARRSTGCAATSPGLALDRGRSRTGSSRSRSSTACSARRRSPTRCSRRGAATRRSAARSASSS